MQLQNSFTVNVPIEQTWDVLTDLKRVAPCMPGAQLDEVDGDEYHGTVAVRVGPFSMAYRGVAHFVELDREHFRAVVAAEGRETKGQGTATATIVTALEAAGTGTTAHITTNVDITGKAAQFGRSMLADVSGKLLQQFAERLEADLAPGGRALEPAPAARSLPRPAMDAGPAGSTTTSGTQPRSSALPPDNSINALGLAAGITAQRLPDILVALGAGLGVAGLLRSLRPGSRLLAASSLSFAAGAAVKAIASGRAQR